MCMNTTKQLQLHSTALLLGPCLTSQQVLKRSLHIVVRLPKRLHCRSLIKAHRNQLLHRFRGWLHNTSRRCTSAAASTRCRPLLPAAKLLELAAHAPGCLHLLLMQRLLLLLKLRRCGCHKHLLSGRWPC